MQGLISDVLQLLVTLPEALQHHKRQKSHVVT